MKTLEDSIQLLNQKVYELLQQDAVGNIKEIKELSRVIQRIKRAR